MMATFAEIQDEVLDILHGFSDDLEQVTSLTATLDSSSLSFAVDDAQQISRGLVEIDEELLWVKRVDTSSNTVYLDAFGRGFRNSDAAAHEYGAMVMDNPRFPRVNVKQAIEQVLRSVSPDLFQVAVDETQTVNPAVMGYSAPAGTLSVLSVKYQEIGPTKLWVPVRRWHFNANANTTDFSSGKSIDIYEGMSPGRTIQIVYTKAPSDFASNSSTLASTGLPESCRDVLVYGACARLLAAYEVSRLQQASIEQAKRSELVQPGAALQASRYFQALYLQRLQEERDGLLRQHPVNVHLTR